MKAQIKEKREVAKGTLLVTFDLLGREVAFEPGQYFFVTLPNVGHQDERGLRRHITVVTSPNERGVLGIPHARGTGGGVPRTARRLRIALHPATDSMPPSRF